MKLYMKNLKDLQEKETNLNQSQLSQSRQQLEDQKLFKRRAISFVEQASIKKNHWQSAQTTLESTSLSNIKTKPIPSFLDFQLDQSELKPKKQKKTQAAQIKPSYQSQPRTLAEMDARLASKLLFGHKKIKVPAFKEDLNQMKAKYFQKQQMYSIQFDDQKSVQLFGNEMHQKVTKTRQLSIDSDQEEQDLSVRIGLKFQQPESYPKYHLTPDQTCFQNPEGTRKHNQSPGTHRHKLSPDGTRKLYSPDQSKLAATHVLGNNFANEIGETNRHQESKIKEFQLIVADAAEKIDQNYEHEKSSFRRNSQDQKHVYVYTARPVSVQKELTQEEVLQQEMKNSVKKFMLKLPLPKIVSINVNQEDIFPTKYTDKKGSAWANYWFQNQQKKLKKDQDTSNYIGTIANKVARGFDKECYENKVGFERGDSNNTKVGRSYSLMSMSLIPRKQSLSSNSELYLPLSRRMSDNQRRQDDQASLEVIQGFLFKEQVLNDKRKITTAQNNMFIQEQEIQLPPIDFPEQTLSDEEFDADKFAQLVQDNYDKDSNLSMSKSYLRAKLTFDMKFKEQYFRVKNEQKQSENSSLYQICSSSSNSLDDEFTQTFDAVHDGHRGINKAVEEIVDKKNFNKLVKTARKNNLKIGNLKEIKEQTAQLAYIQDAVLKTNPIPFITQIDKGQLLLRQIGGFNQDMCAGFRKAMRTLKDPITALIFDRNLIQDSVQAEIISAVANRPQLRCIKMIGNSFNRNSLLALKPLLQFDSFAKLDELSISNCHTDQRSVFELLKCLLPQKAQLNENDLVDYRSDEDSEDVNELQKTRKLIALKKNFKQIQNELVLVDKDKLPTINRGNHFLAVKNFAQALSQKFSQFNKTNRPGEDEKKYFKIKQFKKEIQSNLITEEEGYQYKVRQQEIIRELRVLVAEQFAAQKQKSDLNETQRSITQGKSIKSKTSQNQTAMQNDNILQVLPCLTRLGLASAIENGRVFAMLLKVLEMNQKLVEIDLSWNKLLPTMVADLIEVFSKFGLNLQDINLSWINFGSAQITSKLQNQFSNFIAKSRSLIHLNLSQTNLSPDLLTKILINTKRSTTLLSVHLCQAQLTDINLEFIHNKLKCVRLPSQKQEMDFAINDYEVKFKQKHQILHELMQYKDELRMSKDQLKSVKISHGSKHDCKCLILSRVLGHSEIANSSLWKASEECWICEKWRYTVVIFDKETRKKHLIQDQLSVHKIQQIMLKTNPYFKAILKQADDEDSEPPEELTNFYICGTFTHWKPHKMHSLVSLIYKLEKSKNVGAAYYKYRTELLANFKSRLLKCLPYGSDASLFNFPSVKELVSGEDRFYVYVDFVKPGKHKYFVTYEENNELKTCEPKMFCVEPFRGHLKINLKEYKMGALTRNFTKEKSMFKDWKECNQKSLLAGFIYELQYWRIPKFVKDEEMQKKVHSIICNNRDLIKTVFIMLCSKSSYPSLSWLDFQAFLNQLEIVGVPGFQSSDADRVYIAAKVPNKELMGSGLPESFMSRFEFLEAIVRVADQRFVQTKQIQTIDIALVRVIELIKDKIDIQMWLPWRKTKLWTMEVNDLLENNKHSLMRLYKRYFKDRKNFMIMQDALGLITWETPLQVADKEALFAYGMCKMSCNNDILDRANYDKLQFVEFIEYLARIAHYKYQDEQIELVDKIDKLFDIIFNTMGLKKRSKYVELEYISCSEDDYDEKKYLTALD